jgi:hypothetical protein
LNQCGALQAQFSKDSFNMLGKKRFYLHKIPFRLVEGLHLISLHSLVVIDDDKGHGLAVP